MSRGRKKIPTKIKELQGTLKTERVLENEMQVTLVADIPPPPEWLSEIGKNADGTLKHMQAVPYQKIANDALDRALKIATQFGFTPTARSSINQPTLIQNNNEFNFFD